ncbi:MAG: hypothetical protein IKJ82_01555 [Oscillospiraceae bacterium]|nr:hypothetical protein [Oscillospiraceae bacterium]
MKNSKKVSCEKSHNRFYNVTEKFPFYGKEAKAALCGEAPMTQEIFNQCFNLAAYLYDFDMANYLLLTFPEFI